MNPKDETEECGNCVFFKLKIEELESEKCLIRKKTAEKIFNEISELLILDSFDKLIKEFGDLRDKYVDD